MNLEPEKKLLYLGKHSLQNNLNISVQKKNNRFLSAAAEFIES